MQEQVIEIPAGTESAIMEIAKSSPAAAVALIAVVLFVAYLRWQWKAQVEADKLRAEREAKREERDQKRADECHAIHLKSIEALTKSNGVIDRNTTAIERNTVVLDRLERGS